MNLAHAANAAAAASLTSAALNSLGEANLQFPLQILCLPLGGTALEDALVGETVEGPLAPIPSSPHECPPQHVAADLESY